MNARRSSAWMFEDWPDGTYPRQTQILSTTLTRIAVIAVFKPLRPVVKALARTGASR